MMPAPMDGGSPSQTDAGDAVRLGLAAGVLLFALVVLRTAWLGDDAYITFRSVDNLIHGYGFRWNVAERVQPFTHPLWALLLVVPMAVTGEAYFAPLLLSMGLAFAAVWLFARHVSTSPSATLVAFAAFVFSKAFVEYATSGLENPATTLLLVLFLWQWWSGGPRREPRLWLVTGLLLLNRLDAGLLVLPALAALAWQRPLTDTIRSAAVGLMPFLAWEIFSVVYYGFPFPNTAYAKLGTGIGSGELASQGLLYLLDSATTDPVTLLVVLTGLAAAAAYRQQGTASIALGIGLYLVYIVRIGGDFMTGRFLVTPLLCATAVLARQDWARVRGVATPFVAAIMFLGTFATIRPPITSTRDTFARNDAEGMGIGQIADERAFYYRVSGLLRWSREAPLPADPLMVSEGIRLRNSGEVLATRNVGFFGYFAGPGVHIVDLMALSDPLLARLPAVRPWRIGHFERRVPEGYLESIRNGRNQVVDPDTAILYEDLRLVTRDPLWTWRRWRAIARLNHLW